MNANRMAWKVIKETGAKPGSGSYADYERAKHRLARYALSGAFYLAVITAIARILKV